MASPSRRDRKAILGKKVGMTRVFDENGKHVPVTIIQAGPCTVLQVKTEDTDGYEAVQLGFDEVRKGRKKPQQARFDKLGVKQQRFVREVPRVDPADVRASGAPPAPSAGDDGAEGEEEGSAEAEAVELAPGTCVTVESFSGVSSVDIRGVSKGRGFSGGVRRHGFRTGDESHGGKSVRLRGSTGMHTDPGRVFKGTKMPGQYGNKNCKVMNVDVVSVDGEDHLLIVKGSVPGPRGGYLYIEESLKS